MDSPQRVVLDMDSTEIPVYGEQEQSAYNGHFESTCYHPLLLFNGEGDCLGAKLRPGNVHSAEDWDEVLLPEIERQQALGKEVVFRADAAFAKPEIYEALEERGVKYAIRIPANDSLGRDIAELLTRPAGRPSHKPIVWYKGFLYQAASWRTARRVVAKVEFHAGELFPRVGFIVTNLETPSRAVVRFYNKRGTAEQWIKEGKQAVKMTRLSCHRFRSNQVRLALSLLAYNLGNLWRRLALPRRIENWSLTSSAATAGEDWRTAGEACALLLATAGGRTSDATAVRSDAGPYCSAADTDGIDRRGPLKQRNLSAKGSARRRSVAKVAEYRAISAGRVRISEPLRGGQYENCFTLSANSGMGVSSVPFLNQKGDSGLVNRQIPKNPRSLGPRPDEHLFFHDVARKRDECSIGSRVRSQRRRDTNAQTHFHATAGFPAVGFIYFERLRYSAAVRCSLRRRISIRNCL
jgi:hypothetical protein